MGGPEKETPKRAKNHAEMQKEKKKPRKKKK